LTWCLEVILSIAIYMPEEKTLMMEKKNQIHDTLSRRDILSRADMQLFSKSSIPFISANSTFY